MGSVCSLIKGKANSSKIVMQRTAHHLLALREHVKMPSDFAHRRAGWNLPGWADEETPAKRYDQKMTAPLQGHARDFGAAHERTWTSAA
jgi:hypothetical protein